MININDQLQRQNALDVTESFIVQAPAGSGKTELLTQRFLALLATVRYAPEEVVAITFTRKAATEMRARIFSALNYARTHNAPEKPHELITWELAQKVLIKDQHAKWNLLSNPNRLRILTIDALCARIAKSAPLISHFGTLPQITEDAEIFYRQAVQMLLSSLESETTWNNALSTLLLHLDNNFSLIENLFVGMLHRRDQWLPHIMSHRHVNDSREILELGLQNIILDTLNQATKLFSDEDKIELLELASFAGQILRDETKPSFIKECNNLTQFPTNELINYKIWKGLSELLLTTTYEWRRTVNKNCGFPAPSTAINQDDAYLFKNKKERMLLLLERLSSNELLRIALKNILTLPPPHYSEQQWQIINCLVELLPILVAYLNIIFKEQNITDFTAVSQGAIYALGDTENLSDIALNLDYQIKHLLVDEFQDTSVTQFRLLELLTAGWQQNDGRTLFLVGDPMQSIYRFREAEVGLFLRIKIFGINDIKLKSLTLNVNFRSNANIINWLNDNFKSIFPNYENIELGAIPFSPSTAFSKKIDSENIFVHSFFNTNDNEEANYIVQLVKKINTEHPNQSIAILVRSRNHLQKIIPQFKKSNLIFQAVEIEKLIYSSVIQDLFTLTKALTHLGDRIAWLALLRAPWCGLSLNDLYLIANHNTKKTLWYTIKNYQKVENLSIEANKRIARILPVLTMALNQRSRVNLREWISSTWNRLGGPACIEEEYEIEHVSTYLNILDYFRDNSVIGTNYIEEKLYKTYNHSSNSNANIHLMTIHKAKGLEFDTVIIPSLDKKPAIDENQLLTWIERQNNQGKIDLILAPIKSSEDDVDTIYKYIRDQNKLKLQFEVSRLLYVAVTRAKENLHLIGTVFSDNESTQFKSPSKGSFLDLLWSSLQKIYEDKFNEKLPPKLPENSHKPNYLERHKIEWQCPTIINQFDETTFSLGNNQFNWDSTYLHYVGTLIHRILQDLNDAHMIENTFITDTKKSYWQKQLSQLGVPQNKLLESVRLIEKAITTTLHDSRARWIFSSKHTDIKSEFSISINDSNEVTHYIMDKTFIDEQGFRWIIDYKTTELLDSDEALFLIKAKIHHAPQLENYARAMAKYESRKIKLGLYFPLFSGWCEWDYIPKE